MLTLQSKTDVVLSLGIMADALLTAVHTHSDHAPDPNCEAVERFISHLNDSGDMRSAVLSLGAAIEHLVNVPASGVGRSPSISLVYLLVLAMGNPAIAQHVDIPSRCGKGH